MEIYWILFRVIDKQAFDLVALNTTKRHAPYGMYSVGKDSYYYMHTKDPKDENEIYVGTIDRAKEVITLLSIGVSHREIRKQYEVQDDG